MTHIRQFIERFIPASDGGDTKFYDHAEKELQEAIEKDWEVEYGTIPKGPDGQPHLIAKYKETWREGFQAGRMGKNTENLVGKNTNYGKVKSIIQDKNGMGWVNVEDGSQYFILLNTLLPIKYKP